MTAKPLGRPTWYLSLDSRLRHRPVLCDASSGHDTAQYTMPQNLGDKKEWQSDENIDEGLVHVSQAL